MDYGLLTQRTAGSVKVFPTGTGMEAALTVGMDFPFDDNIWKALAERILAWPTAIPLDVTQTTFRASPSRVVGPWKVPMRFWAA